MATFVAISEKTQTATAMKRVLNYVMQDKKTNYNGVNLVSGQNCVPESAYEEFMATKNHYGKASGVFFKQYVQSFKPDCGVTPQTIHKIGLEMAKAFAGFEVVVATHIDRDHWHNHFVVNSVNCETGELHICRQVTCVDGKIIVSTPKTKTSERIIILPESVVGVLSKYKDTVNSEWVFPSPLNKDLPREPTSVYKKTQRILERAGCKKVRFHDLRHTFATNALANGVDIKTLSMMIGHVSAETTIDIYLHSTIEMKKIAADKIDNKMGRNRANTETSEAGNDTTPKEDQKAEFKPKNGKHRKSATGCISKISENLYEGRYSPKYPNGKRVARNVYAHTEEECEKLLSELIVNMKAEIQQERERLEAEELEEKEVFNMLV